MQRTEAGRYLLCADLRIRLEHALPPLHGVLLLQIDLQQLAIGQVPVAILRLDGLCELTCTIAQAQMSAIHSSIIGSRLKKVGPLVLLLDKPSKPAGYHHLQLHRPLQPIIDADLQDSLGKHGCLTP